MARSGWLMTVAAMLVALGALAPANDVRAESLAVVELFTSQGCSSCPAADRLFKSYAARNDLVAISYSVDYWDYLGWKDTLAAPKFAARQRAYAKSRGDGRVYTPQVVVNGSTHVVGSDKVLVDEAIERANRAATPARIPLRCWIENGAVVVEIGQAQTKASGTVWLALVEPKVEVEVKHGENRGKSLAYHNVVRDLVPAGMYSGTATSVRMPLSALTNLSQLRIAAILQEGTGGAIVGAAWIGAGK